MKTIYSLSLFAGLAKATEMACPGSWCWAITYEYFMAEYDQATADNWCGCEPQEAMIMFGICDETAYNYSVSEFGEAQANEYCEYTPPSSAPTSYAEYVPSDAKPVCGKQVTGGAGMCNLFKSCFADFNSGVTGRMHCQSTCDKMVEFFPREMCKADNKNAIDAGKWTIDEANNSVCWKRTKNHSPVCVAVDGFADMA